MLDNGNFGKFLVAVMKAELLCLSFFLFFVDSFILLSTFMIPLRFHHINPA